MPGFFDSKSAMCSLVISLLLYMTVSWTVPPLPDELVPPDPASQAASSGAATAPPATAAAPVRKPRRLILLLLCPSNIRLSSRTGDWEGILGVNESETTVSAHSVGLASL